MQPFMLQTNTCLPLVAHCPTQCGQFLWVLSSVLIIMAGLILSRLPQQNSNWNVKSVKQLVTTATLITFFIWKTTNSIINNEFATSEKECACVPMWRRTVCVLCTSMHSEAFIALCSAAMTHQWVTGQKRGEELLNSSVPHCRLTVGQGAAAGLWCKLAIQRKLVVTFAKEPVMQLRRGMTQQWLMNDTHYKAWGQGLGGWGCWCTVNERFLLTLGGVASRRVSM